MSGNELRKFRARATCPACPGYETGVSVD